MEAVDRFTDESLDDQGFLETVAGQGKQEVDLGQDVAVDHGLALEPSGNGARSHEFHGRPGRVGELQPSQGWPDPARCPLPPPVVSYGLTDDRDDGGDLGAVSTAGRHELRGVPGEVGGDA